MTELKKILTAIVNDLEKSAVAALVSQAGVTPEAAILTNKGFYDDLRKKIDTLK